MKKKGADIKVEVYHCTNGDTLSDLYLKKTDTKIMYWITKVNPITQTATLIYGADIGKPVQIQKYNVSTTDFMASIREIVLKGYVGLVSDINKGSLHPLPYEAFASIGKFKLMLDAILLNNKAIASLETVKVIRTPMKAHLIKNAKIDFPCYAQFKLNGFRCLYDRRKKKQLDLFDQAEKFENIPMSKQGSEYIMPNISNQVDAKHDGIPLDGEFYKHGMHLSEIESIGPSMSEDDFIEKCKSEYSAFDIDIWIVLKFIRE
jgi:hypothetical protein